MTFSLLIAVSVLLFLVMVGISLLLFGREWLHARREKKFARDLDAHSGLVSRLRSSSAEEFEGAFRHLAALPDFEMREAVLHRAAEEAPPESLLLLLRSATFSPTGSYWEGGHFPFPDGDSKESSRGRTGMGETTISRWWRE